MARLGVNIDHVATIRQARYRAMPDSLNAEPDPVQAALEAEAGGASGITAHLRQDRRHIQDRDIFALRERIGTKLNLEMGVTDEILRIALEVGPDDVCLVPENRQEVTTEGGLDVAGQRDAVARMTGRLHDAGVAVSLFIDPDEIQVEAANAVGARIIELHTGAFANAADDASRESEVQRLARAARLAHRLNLQVNAGHGINYRNIVALGAVPFLAELNIGHSIVSRATWVGFRQATAEMAEAISRLPETE